MVQAENAHLAESRSTQAFPLNSFTSMNIHVNATSGARL
jgi:hypothetical protein